MKGSRKGAKPQGQGISELRSNDPKDAPAVMFVMACSPKTGDFSLAKRTQRWLLAPSTPPAPLHGSVIREVFLVRLSGALEGKEAAWSI